MVVTHSLGFPRIGVRRELKFALEAYWKGESSREALVALGAQLAQRNWKIQAGLDLVPVGDFSFYDQVLDMTFTLGNLPERVRGFGGDPLDNYFRLARGRSVDSDRCGREIAAGEMTKWFDTNYHYIVPEFDAATEFSLDATRLLEQLAQAQRLGVRVKPVILGPVTYLLIGKSRDGSEKLDLLERLVPVYAQLLEVLAAAGAEWVQVDEPVLVADLDANWKDGLDRAYRQLASSRARLLLATYYGPLKGNLDLTSALPVAGLHLDAINAREEVTPLVSRLPSHMVLSLGVINGRNIWKADLNATLDWLEPLQEQLDGRLWIAPSCSLAHVPVDLSRETELDPELRSWLAFALQKIDEMKILGTALNRGRRVVQAELDDNRAAMSSRRDSSRVTNPAVRAALARIEPALGRRRSCYAIRAPLQAVSLDLPRYPTTTIGSFPQTAAIRQARHRFRSGGLGEAAYRNVMHAEIARCIHEQEALGLDVLVHGEPERNDMVEYFAEQLDGFAITRFGWVQSYGSRCVKPPILYGDVSRPNAMTVAWIEYTQSLTTKPVKGMLTGPVTMLNWSFARDDEPRSVSCYQLALAIRKEVLDLERSGVRVIQIDEAALREGLPLRKALWGDYLAWAVESFRIAANGVADGTQIHTHMCYSEFNDIIAAIAGMDADVITIEASRSNMDLLEALDKLGYPNAIGPGVYDIHSPVIPTREQMVGQLRRAEAHIPAERLWVNPDCGLKTRQWEEVVPALRNMVAAARELRGR